MKKIFLIITAAAAFGVQAQSTDELELLKKQLSDLSAKVAQMEKDNSAKIAQLEKDSNAKSWSIEQLQAEGKKDEAASWANNIKLTGDIRARYENREVDNETAKDRQRIRLRAGAYGKVNDQVDFGVRLATGGSRTSSNQDMDGSGSMKDIYLDQAYIDYHPDQQIPGMHAFIGKMPQPWMAAGSGLVWDSDLNPEGVAVTYEKQLTPFKLKANAGTFVMEDEQGDDIQLWAGQVAGEKQFSNGHTLTLGMSDYYFENADSKNLTGILNAKSANTAGGDFHLVEGFASYAFMVAKLPVRLDGQYVVNVDAADSDEDTAYLAGITIGKAKDPGTWEVGYSWREIGNDAVVGGLNDSDFAGETWTGCYGHVFKGKYQIMKNMSADLAYILSTDWQGRDANTLQADLNFKF